MKAGDVFTASDGNDYRVCEVPEFKCVNCSRVTTTGLCGCENAMPVEIGSTRIGFPVSAEPKRSPS